MTPKVQLEVERKYEVPAHAEPDWSAMPILTVDAGESPRALTTEYFDTPQRRLADHGVVLRRRHGGPDAGWHLKYRTGQGKHELQVPLLKTSNRMPAQMKQYVNGLSGGQELESLATVANNRRVLYAVHPQHGPVAEICLDDVVATDRRAGLRRSWVECEVELVNGSGADPDAVFDEIEAVLFASGLKASASTAKIARALGADDHTSNVMVTDLHGEPVAATAQKSGVKKQQKKIKQPQKSLQDHIRGLMASAVAEVVSADFLVRVGDPNGVHAVRVAARRVVALIDGMGPELAGKSHRKISARVAELSDRLSAARDAEVVVDMLPQRAAMVDGHMAEAELRQLIERAERARDSERATVVRYIGSNEHAQFLTDVESWAQSVALRSQARELSGKKLATRAVKRWVQAVHQADQSLNTGPAHSTKLSHVVDRVHVHRKAIRNLRYGLDAVALTPGLKPKKPWRGVLDSTPQIQQELSEVMDSAVLDDWLASAGQAIKRAGGDRYAVGLLHGYERARVHGYQQSAPGLIDRLLSELSPQD